MEGIERDNQRFGPLIDPISNTPSYAVRLLSDAWGLLAHLEARRG